MDQFGRQIWESIILPLRPSVLNGDVLAVNMAYFAELLSEGFNVVGLQGRRGNAEVTDPGHFSRPLRARGKRPCGRSAEKRDELAALHHDKFPARLLGSQLVGLKASILARNHAV